MAVNRQKYGQYVESYLKAGATPAEANKLATKKAEKVAQAVKAEKKKKQAGFLKKTARRMKEVFRGKKTYAKKKVYNVKLGRWLSPDGTKKVKATKRTKKVKTGLKTAGLTEEEIRKLKRK